MRKVEERWLRRSESEEMVKKWIGNMKFLLAVQQIIARSARCASRALRASQAPDAPELPKNYQCQNS